MEKNVVALLTPTGFITRARHRQALYLQIHKFLKWYIRFVYYMFFLSFCIGKPSLFIRCTLEVLWDVKFYNSIHWLITYIGYINKKLSQFASVALIFYVGCTVYKLTVVFFINFIINCMKVSYQNYVIVRIPGQLQIWYFQLGHL